MLQTIVGIVPIDSDLDIQMSSPDIFSLVRVLGTFANWAVS
ncbi:hypothetical protein [Pyrococcus kukulkanii]